LNIILDEKGRFQKDDNKLKVPTVGGIEVIQIDTKRLDDIESFTLTTGDTDCPGVSLPLGT